MSALEVPLPAELADQDGIPEELLDYILARIEQGTESLPEAQAHAYEPAAARWTVDGLGSAEWAMRNVARVDAEAVLVAEQARAWQERIDAWRIAAERRLRTRREFFVHHLTAYALAERERSDGKVKSIKLPSGTIRTSSAKAKPTVVSEQDVIAWARENLEPDEVAAVVKVTEKALVSELRKAVELVEVVDHLRVVCSPCGCIVDPWPTVAGIVPGHGDGVTCPSCESEALIGRWEVVASHSEVRDRAGRPVPGVGVEPAHVEATVVPS